MRVPALAAAFLVLPFAAACPKGPVASMRAIDSASDVEALRETFNADASERRLLVLLSPT